ncbi:MAG TPA: right-handed parallel beta-helix repeat-containing protein [Azospirillum sp.]|nr:right-handed parallel beta-helix repeat-containing protein [Azospirillum sp.]
MTDLYVSTSGSDSNAGTQASPFRTIQKASTEASAGTTVHVAPGTYEGGFQTTASGSADAPIRYVSDVKWGAKIVPGTGNDKYEAWDNRGSNVVIDGFEVDGSASQGGTPWLFGIYTAGSNSVVQNSKVHDILQGSDAMAEANTGVGGAGIMGDGWTGGTDIKVLNNEVYNIGPAGESSSLVHGVYMATSGQVQDNLVYHVVGDGITTWHDATNLKILDNVVAKANGVGIMIGSGDHYNTSGPNDYTQVVDNIVYDNAKGIEEYGETGSHNSYVNNHVNQNGTDWNLQNGLTPINSGSAAAAEPSAEHLAAVQQAAVPAAPVTVAPPVEMPSAEHLAYVQQVDTVVPAPVEVAPPVEMPLISPDAGLGAALVPFELLPHAA